MQKIYSIIVKLSGVNVMKITGYSVHEENIELKQPFVTAKRRIDVIRDYVLTLETDTGICGYGACAPTPVITGDTVGSILYALNEIICPTLVGKELDEGLLELTQNVLFHNSSAKAAADIALYDLLAKQSSKPLYEYLGASGTQKLITDATVSLGTVEAMIAETKKHLSDGFSVLKVKLGGKRDDDKVRIDALASAIPGNVVVRLDANQGWSVDDAVYLCNYAEQSGLNIDLVEQPIHYQDLKGMEAVTKNTALKILADESVFDVYQAERIIEMGAADMINIKLMKCGGVYEALKIASLAKQSNMECMLGCMMEGPVSVTAAAHFGAAVGISRFDLDAPFLCKSIPIAGSNSFDGENISLGKEAGLGITEIFR